MAKKKRRSGGWDPRGPGRSASRAEDKTEGEVEKSGDRGSRTDPQARPTGRPLHERRLSGSARKAAREREAKRKRQMVVYGVPAGIAVVVILVILLALGGGPYTGGGSEAAPAGSVTVSPGGFRPSPIAKGKIVPSFTAPALSGGTVSWKPGQPTVLVVWASWCQHCQAELPVLQGLHDKYPGVTMTSITSAQGQEQGPTAEDLVAQDHITFPVAVDDAAQTLLNALGVNGFPTIYFINADGTVFDQRSGETPPLALDLAFQHLQQQAGT